MSRRRDAVHCLEHFQLVKLVYRKTALIVWYFRTIVDVLQHFIYLSNAFEQILVRKYLLLAQIFVLTSQVAFVRLQILQKFF